VIDAGYALPSPAPGLGIEWDRAAIDARALARAREAARREGRSNVTWKRGRLDRVPLGSGSADVVLLSQVLHRVRDPAALVREAARVVVPGGCVLVMDLLPHREAWVTERLGHTALGFPPAQVEGWLRAAGLAEVRSEEAARRRGNPFTVLVASARRPAGKRRARP
jgi:ArsR family transcriptional regulator